MVSMPLNLELRMDLRLEMLRPGCKCEVPRM